jgi:ATP-binding protein involved in chromosome partitioning
MASAWKPNGSAPSFSGEVQLDPTIRETSDGGTPITVAEPDNPHALVFCRMGAHLG